MARFTILYPEHTFFSASGVDYDGRGSRSFRYTAVRLHALWYTRYREYQASTACSVPSGIKQGLKILLTTQSLELDIQRTPLNTGSVMNYLT